MAMRRVAKIIIAFLLILAFAVITILAFSCSTCGVKPEEKIRLLGIISSTCTSYTNLDPQCTDFENTYRRVGESQVNGMLEACKTLNVCTKTENQSTCLEKCCLACPRRQ